jgi:sugar phosphate permease
MILEPEAHVSATASSTSGRVSTAVSMPGALPRYRWVILVVALAVMTTSYAVRLAWANVATTVAGQLSLSATMLGSFVTAFFVGYVITNAVSGFIADRYGPRRVICLGLIPLAFFVASFGLVGSYKIGLVVQFGVGLAAGSNFSATNKVVAIWFGPKERGLAFGVLTGSSSLALILSNALFPAFIAVTSWQQLYFALGGGVLSIALLAFIFARDAPADATIAAVTTSEPFYATARGLLADRDYLLLALSWFGALWGTWGMSFWANALMVKGHGLTNVAAGQITALVGIGGLISKPLYGWLSDFLPVQRRTMLVPCFFGFAILLICFGLATTETEFRFLAPLLGVFAFAYSPIMSAILTEIIGSRKVGAASGLTNAFSQCGAVIAPLAVGYAFQATGSFLLAFEVLAAGPFLATICIVFVRERR